jgi:hypothetical protein
MSGAVRNSPKQSVRMMPEFLFIFISLSLHCDR